MKRVKLFRKNKVNKAISEYEKSIEAGRFSQHVLPYNSKWAVKAMLDDKVDKIFDLQQSAIEYAKQKAKSTGSSLFIHNREGYIRQRNSYERRINLSLK